MSRRGRFASSEEYEVEARMRTLLLAIVATG